jgi:uncharacterized membrane protein YbhN (UPF0104 family)
VPDAADDPLPAKVSMLRRAWRLLRYVIAAAILWFFFSQVDAASVWSAIRRADLAWLGAACAASIVLQWTIALRLRQLIVAQDIELSTAELFEINLATTFYGLFLPGGNFTGLAVRFFRLGKRGGDLTGAGVALLIDRIVATISLCVVGIAFWLLERPSGTLAIFLVMVGCTVAMVLLCAAITARLPLPRPLARWGDKLHLAMRKWRTMSPAAHMHVMILGVASHVIGIVVFVCLAWSLQLHVAFISLGWIRSAVILATMIPISIAGLGLREGAMLATLAAYSISDADALAMSLLVFGVVMLLPGMIGGAFEARRLLRG